MKLHLFGTLLHSYSQTISNRLETYRPLLFIIIIAIAAYLRLCDLGNNFIFSDFGRDTLVAKHIAYGWTHDLHIAPNSSLKLIPHTPVYFTFLAVLYLVAPNPISMQVINAIISLFLVYVAYKIGTLSGNYITGLICGLCVAVSPILVYYGRLVSQFSLIPVFVGCSIYYLYLSFIQSGKTNTKNLILSILCFTPGLLLHNVTLSIWPFFLLSWFFSVTKLNIRFPVKIIVTAILFCQILLFILLIHPGAGNTYELVRSFISYSPQQYLVERFKNASDLLLTSLNIKYEFIGSVILWLLYSLIYKNKLRPIHTFLYVAGLGSFIISLLLPVQIYHLHYLLPAFLIIPLLFVLNLWSHRENPYSFVLKIIITGFYIFHSLTQPISSFVISNNSSYKVSQIIASTILKKSLFVKNNVLFHIVLPLAPAEGIARMSDWFSGSIWYALEEKTHRKLVSIVPTSEQSPNNIYVPGAGERYILLCAEDPKSDFLKQSVCLGDWKFNYSLPIRPIDTVSDNGVTFTVYETI